MPRIIDSLRSIIDRIEAKRDDFVLSRDPEFVGSLHEADEDLREGRTTSLSARTRFSHNVRSSRYDPLR